MKKEILILLMISLIFVAGCGYLGSNRVDVKRGVGIIFLPNQPPNEISESDRIGVGIEVINNADTDISGELCLTDTIQGKGIEKECNSFNLISAEITYDKSGSIKNVISSSEKFYFPDSGQGYGYEGIRANFDMDVIATVEYDYLTEIITQFSVCDVNSATCKTEETIGGNKLGRKSITAPITVTNIEKTLSPAGRGVVNVRLVIDIQNVAGGNIVSNEGGSVEKLSYFNINFVGADTQFNCPGLNQQDGVILRNGKTQVSCSAIANVEEGQSIDNQLEINFGYRYRAQISKRVTVNDEQFI